MTEMGAILSVCHQVMHGVSEEDALVVKALFSDGKYSLTTEHNKAAFCVLHCHTLDQGIFDKLVTDFRYYDPHAILVICHQTAEEFLVRAHKFGLADAIVMPMHPEIIKAKVSSLARYVRSDNALSYKQRKMDEVVSRIQQEESFAHHVYEEITGSSTKKTPDYFTLQYSAGGFSGDFFFEMKSPTGIRYVFLADAMGHGLAAALSIMPVINVVKAMAHRSMPIISIMHEVNRRLNNELPDDRFVAMAALEISPFSKTISVVNAGLPALFVESEGGEIEACRSQVIPLGIEEGAAFSFQPYSYDLDEVSQILMYTDGLIEQPNEQGVCITEKGLLSRLGDCLKQNIDWQHIAEQFNEHRGATALSDDVSLCAIDVSELKFEQNERASEPDDRIGEVNFTLDISGEYLRQFDVPAFVSKFLYATGIEGKIAGKAFTAVAELYQNGLDHGVLGLDSALKNDIDGFTKYLEQREHRMSALADDDKVSLAFSYSGVGGLQAFIQDSGAGYERKDVSSEGDALHGRGIALVKELTESCEFNERGNAVSIVIRED